METKNELLGISLDRSVAFSGKKVLVMGLGLHGGGVGVVRFLARCGARITVTDLRTKKELAPSLSALAGIKGITYVLGRHRTRDFANADIVIKNPGVRPHSPYLATAKKNGVQITSDIGIFFQRCQAPIIGVTGTRGKSTTAYLIWLFLKTKYGKKVFLAGNIRKSVLEILPKIKKGDVIVLELSSFQLTDLRQEKISPAIAVFTNIQRDHLNWHTSMQDYIRAKSAIFAFQKPDDYLFTNPHDRTVCALAKKAHQHVVLPRIAPLLKKIADENLGAHYESSVALASAVARHLHIPASAIEKTLRSFHGLPERQEEIALKNGVHFIDDTTATTPDAAIAAVQRFRKKTGRGRLILIAGGSDKKLDFRKFVREIVKSADRVIFLPGSATEKIKNQELTIKAYEAASMAEAVAAAYRMAEKGDYILLSPGAASFGLFLNEFDRGFQFQKAVKRL